MKDCDVIKAFVAYLRENGHPTLEVDRWPDKERDSDIDAIAGPFAIEHTSIDTLPNQRRDSDWFMRVVGGIKQELVNMPPFRLNISIEYDAVTKEQDWRTIRQNLKDWITNESRCFPDGRHVLDDIPGVPFRLHVKKASDRPPGVFFARFEPDDDTLSNRIRSQLDRKANKLKRYQGHLKKTVLLVENEDIALMNEGKMLDAIQEAYPGGRPHGVDQIWYADTSIPEAIEFKDFTPDL